MVVADFGKGRQGQPGDTLGQLVGSALLREKLCGLEFIISPQSFFQTNPKQTEILYNAVAEAAGAFPNPDPPLRCT